MAVTTPHHEIEAVTHRWEAALAAHDVDALVATYAPDAELESPLVPYILGNDWGLVRGHAELRPFLLEVCARTPEVRGYHRGGFMTDGRRAMWEYPRHGPEGEQMDFVEVMEIEGALIQRHHVYWGWRGVQILRRDAYYR